MAEINWVDGEEQKAKAAIDDVRKDGSPTDWAAISFSAPTGAGSQKMKFVGSGSGGTDELKGVLVDTMPVFGLVRVTDRIDNSVTVKFVWVNWLGASTGRMMKGRLSTQVGGIKECIGQHHIMLECSSQEEISHQIIMEKVMATSGSGSKVLDARGQAQFRSQATSAGTESASQRGPRKADDEATLGAGCSELITAIRNGDIDWCALTYENSKSATLVPHGSGNGGAEELREKLDDDKVIYALVRKIEQIDDSQVVKFCLVKWLGPGIPVMQKAKIGTHAGAVKEFLHPFHVTIDSPDKPEVNDANVMKQINVASGTYEHTLADNHPNAKNEVVVRATRKVSVAQASKPEATEQPIQRAASVVTRGMGGVLQSENVIEVEQVIILEDGDAIKAGVQSVRADDNDNDWVLVTYTAPKSKTLKLHASGTGGLSELKSHLKDDVVMYGLYRTTDKIDETVAVKFCYIDWRGENINRMQRANLGIHSGAVQDLFRPYHVDIQPTNLDEVTQEIIMTKVKFSSGTADHVL